MDAPNLVKLQAAIVEAHRARRRVDRRKPRSEVRRARLDSDAAWQVVHRLIETEVLPFHLHGRWRCGGTLPVQYDRPPLIDHINFYRQVGSKGPHHPHNTVFISEPYQHFNPPVDDWIETIPLGFGAPRTSRAFRVRKLEGVSWYCPRLISEHPVSTAYLVADPGLWRDAVKEAA